MGACRVLRPGGQFICVSNNASLLRSHARKVPGWSQAPGCPFPLPHVDDEVWIHCYTRDGAGVSPCSVSPSLRSSAFRPRDSHITDASDQDEVLIVVLALPWAAGSQELCCWCSESGGRLFVSHVDAAPASETRAVDGKLDTVFTYDPNKPQVVSVPPDGVEVKLPPGFSACGIGENPLPCVARFKAKRRELLVEIRREIGALGARNAD